MLIDELQLILDCREESPVIRSGRLALSLELFLGRERHAAIVVTVCPGSRIPPTGLKDRGGGSEADCPLSESKSPTSSTGSMSLDVWSSARDLGRAQVRLYGVVAFATLDLGCLALANATGMKSGEGSASP